MWTGRQSRRGKISATLGCPGSSGERIRRKRGLRENENSGRESGWKTGAETRKARGGRE